MTNKVYINNTSKFLPNEPIENDEMELILGMVDGKPSRYKNIILRQNGIKKRYYVINKEGDIVYSNAEITANAIRNLESNGFNIKDIEVLSCGTTMADQLAPSHASMVHGELKNRPIEVVSPTGICCSSMYALKYGFLSVMSGLSKNAVCTGSEVISTLLRANKYAKEVDCKKDLEKNPILAFEKGFLRWMLSDAAGAMLLEDEPNRDGISLRIDWIETVSYANEMETCMYVGCEKLENGDIKGWREFDPDIWLEQSIFSVKQDVKLLKDNIIYLWTTKLEEILKRKNINTKTDIDYLLPHYSSMFFGQKLYEGLKEQGIEIEIEKWFTNLSYVGNVASASIYVMLDELFHSGRLKKGERIMLLVPESARFSYAYAQLTVV